MNSKFFVLQGIQLYDKSLNFPHRVYLSWLFLCLVFFLLVSKVKISLWSVTKAPFDVDDTARKQAVYRR